MARFLSRSCVLFLISLVVSSPLVAQTVTGNLEGTALDKSGGALPGVTIGVKNLETGLERDTVTDAKGFYSAPFLPIGRYRVQAELSGFGTMVRQNVPLRLNETTVQNFVLDPAMSETVTVSADAPRVNTTDAEIKGTLTEREIVNKPNLSQNSFLGLAAVFPGYQENPNSGQDNPTLSSGSSVNFNGTGTRGATFQINGVNNDDSSENQNRQSVPLATIKSFQVITSNYSAEFGRGYGAVVLVQTKSGTNDIDGEVYDYVQRSIWNEKSYFSRSSPKPINHRYEYGGVAGFPILRDVLFGFVSYDKVDRQGDLNYNRSILTAADLALPRLTLNNDTPANRAFQDYIIGLFPKGVLPNNAALGARVYSTIQGFNQPDKDLSGRVDWNAKASDALTFRYQRTSQIRESDDIIISEATLQDNRQSNLGATWTDILTSNTVQEARLGLGLRSTNVGVLSGNDSPVLRFGGVSSGPIIGNAGAFPINRNQRDEQLVYNISSVLWLNHTLKGGTDLRRSTLNDRADNFNRGFYNLSATCGGVTYSSSIAAFMAGCISNYQKAYGPNDLKNELAETNVYAQDDWRFRPNLSLNLGVRYEHVKTPKEADDKVVYPFKSSSYIDPRLGFAYTPGWNKSWLDWATGGAGRFSIRGGYGVFHGRLFQTIFSQSGASIRFNPPNAFFYNSGPSTNVADPTNGFVFVPGTPPTARSSITEVAPDLKVPETRQWNLTFERQIFSQQKIRLSYNGNQGRNLLFYGRDNLPLSPLYGPVTVPNHPFNGALAGVTITKVADDWRCAGTGLAGAPTNATCPVAVPLAPNEISLRFPRTNERRPNPLYTTNLVVSNQAQTWYHGGQIEYVTGYMRGLQAQASYTFSKAIDTGSEATAVSAGDTNALYGKNYSRGLSRFDVRHRFSGVISHALPFFADRHDVMGTLLGGWQISTTLRLTSGTPFSVVDTGQVDLDFDGFTETRPILVNTSIKGRHVHGPNTSQSVLRPEYFRRAQFGDKDKVMGRNIFYSDGVKNVDAGLYKTFNLPFRGHQVMFRGEVYNVFNKVQWGTPVNDLASADFGKVLSTGAQYIPRTYQAGLRYIY
jgi:outer membrane receptor protein involved in Fe transport